MIFSWLTASDLTLIQWIALGMALILLVWWIQLAWRRHRISERYSLGNLSASGEALDVRLSLAVEYAKRGDRAQALYWLDEIRQVGSPKQVRLAERHWRELLSDGQTLNRRD